eukprot:PITA_07870
MLKENMVTTLILVFPNWDIDSHVHVDASSIALGAILTQDSGEGLDHHIVFASRRLSKAEKNYSTSEHEGWAMVYVLHKYQRYLLGGHFKMYTDHSALKYLVNKPVLGGAYADADGHFEDIIHFLMTGNAPKGYFVQQKKELVVDAHGGSVGGHYARRAVAQKILHAGLWWLTLHQDSKAHCKACDVCQRTSKPSQRDEMPLNLQMTLQPFEKWAINFVGPIKPQGKMDARYIITAT